MYTMPLSLAEYEQLVAIHYRQPGHPGWALLDDDDHIRGWHPVERTDPNWITAADALRAFVPDTGRRRFLLVRGWQVYEDHDGHHLPALLRLSRGEPAGSGAEADQLTIPLTDQPPEENQP